MSHVDTPSARRGPGGAGGRKPLVAALIGIALVLGLGVLGVVLVRDGEREGNRGNRGDDGGWPKPSGTRIDTRTVTLDSQNHMRMFAVATSWREYVANHPRPGDAMREPPTDFTRNVVVTVSVDSQCRVAKGARLYARGNTLRLEVNLPPQRGKVNCYQPVFAAVDFEVPRERLPGAPTMDDRTPRPNALGILRTTTLVTAGPLLGVVAAEVPDAASANAWLRGVPGFKGAGADSGALAEAYPHHVPTAGLDLTHDRVFAYLFPVCGTHLAQLRPGPNGTLDIATTASASTPEPTGSCAPTTYRMAVFSLAPPEIPANPPPAVPR